MEFITPEQDRWHTVADDQPVTPAAGTLLSWAQWREARATWPADLKAGVVFPNDADIEELADDLPRLDLVVLQFPKWTDGRAYSQARLLRTRFRFQGQVRAVGDVVVDMVPLLARTGVDAVVLRAGQSVEIARSTLGFFPSYYQGDVHQHQPLFKREASAGAAEVTQ
ncbi:DUF934 domain-containing protein [Caldimonas brevitalea]|uniref:Oxidoreductase probably involved in sulfite reduction n=1 Tax=Caldimonas brevitalea TaxID=413882 RepID=A0A0G3BH82_9BURK|nr:DUF934 domain-containing protein [Caldimonas brevitalea]AKJ28722.1 oxidoreductase probably involved in sulfite reduction [Caldimonas brevitalea]